MGWAIGSIAIGLAILLSVRHIIGWMAAADDEPLVRESRRFLPSWVTPQRERIYRAAWVVTIGIVFIALGASALL